MWLKPCGFHRHHLVSSTGFVFEQHVCEARHTLFVVLLFKQVAGFFQQNGSQRHVELCDLPLSLSDGTERFSLHEIAGRFQKHAVWASPTLLFQCRGCAAGIGPLKLWTLLFPCAVGIDALFFPGIVDCDGGVRNQHSHRQFWAPFDEGQNSRCLHISHRHTTLTHDTRSMPTEYKCSRNENGPFRRGVLRNRKDGSPRHGSQTRRNRAGPAVLSDEAAVAEAALGGRDGVAQRWATNAVRRAGLRLVDFCSQSIFRSVRHVCVFHWVQRGGARDNNRNGFVPHQGSLASLVERAQNAGRSATSSCKARRTASTLDPRVSQNVDRQPLDVQENGQCLATQAGGSRCRQRRL